MRIQLRNLPIADAETFISVEGYIQITDMRGDAEPPESLALGTFFKGILQELGKASQSPLSPRQGSWRSRATRDGWRWAVRNLMSPYCVLSSTLLRRVEVPPVLE